MALVLNFSLAWLSNHKTTTTKEYGCAMLEKYLQAISLTT